MRFIKAVCLFQFSLTLAHENTLAHHTITRDSRQSTDAHTDTRHPTPRENQYTACHTQNTICLFLIISFCIAQFALAVGRLHPGPRVLFLEFSREHAREATDLPAGSVVNHLGLHPLGRQQPGEVRVPVVGQHDALELRAQSALLPGLNAALSPYATNHLLHHQSP